MQQRILAWLVPIGPIRLTPQTWYRAQLWSPAMRRLTFQMRGWAGMQADTHPWPEEHARAQRRGMRAWLHDRLHG